jgi:hypothetical protein
MSEKKQILSAKDEKLYLQALSLFHKDLQSTIDNCRECAKQYPNIKQPLLDYVVFLESNRSKYKRLCLSILQCIKTNDDRLVEIEVFRAYVYDMVSNYDTRYHGEMLEQLLEFWKPNVENPIEEASTIEPEELYSRLETLLLAMTPSEETKCTETKVVTKDVEQINVSYEIDDIVEEFPPVVTSEFKDSRMVFVKSLGSLWCLTRDTGWQSVSLSKGILYNRRDCRFYRLSEQRDLRPTFLLFADGCRLQASTNSQVYQFNENTEQWLKIIE